MEPDGGLSGSFVLQNTETIGRIYTDLVGFMVSSYMVLRTAVIAGVEKDGLPDDRYIAN